MNKSFYSEINLKNLNFAINYLFNIERIRIHEIEILINYEVNTGNPIVEVVMRDPAKIKKGRKG